MRPSSLVTEPKLIHTSHRDESQKPLHGTVPSSKRTRKSTRNIMKINSFLVTIVWYNITATQIDANNMNLMKRTKKSHIAVVTSCNYHRKVDGF